LTSGVKHFDAIIIGSGQAGNPLAATLAAAGKTVAVVESAHVGGTCVNEGCTPTKTMVASAEVAYLVGRGAEYGVEVGAIHTNMARVRERKREIVAKSRGNNEKRLETTAGISLIRGVGSFVGAKTVRVALNGGGESLLAAKLIFINTGLRNSPPRIPGLDGVDYLDNVSIMELDAVPEHLVVLGGGYIGLEFAQMFRRFGSRVTIVQSKSQLLEREDSDIAEEVRKILVEDGIEVLLNAEAVAVRSEGRGALAIEVKVDGTVRTVDGSHLLLAAGRRPNTEALNAAAAGIELDEHGFIRVNERLETRAPGVYALGDVKGGPAFTHISYDDFRIVRANLIDGGQATTTGRMVPYTVFLDPELGRIGLTEAQAREQGLKIKVAKMPMTSVARAGEMARTRGVMKIVVDAETSQILGAAVLGLWGGETAALIQVAMIGKLPYTALRDGIFSHPTLAESLNNLLQKLE
jgi:pyruvate/2-oxoglutarate dehydrogenase complex dihydrolipoamide dehydrogenase (E3) component